MGFRVGFNTQPPEGGWLHQQSQDSDRSSFNTQPPEGGWMASALRSSTSSCFNTQPPEGGWFITKISSVSFGWFQHTAARRRLEFRRETDNRFFLVSTHSRPKAAGCIKFQRWVVCWCFNTQPPEGGWGNKYTEKGLVMVSTHSRPKAAGQLQCHRTQTSSVSTHSRPKAAGSAKSSTSGY